MRSMRLEKIQEIGSEGDVLEAVDLDVPEPGPGQVRLRVHTCGVCHTELDEIEGRTPPPRLPVVPGHQVVGTVEALGEGVGGERSGGDVEVGARVGVAWIFEACGKCAWCERGEENLCPDFRATGRDVDGGYAEHMVVPAAYVHPLPDALYDLHVAPLLCAGAVGYRALRLAGLENGRRLGLTGFGASAHLVMPVARHLFPDSEIFVFAHSESSRSFARERGADWVGATEDAPPSKLDAIIDTTPAWRPVVSALAALQPGGRLVINAIRKEAGDHDRLRDLDYAEHLWHEHELKSVANVTRRDVREFLELAAEVDLEPRVEEFALEDANAALRALAEGGGRGAKVLRVSEG